MVIKIKKHKKHNCKCQTQGLKCKMIEARSVADLEKETNSFLKTISMHRIINIVVQPSENRQFYNTTILYR